MVLKRKILARSEIKQHWTMIELNNVHGYNKEHAECNSKRPIFIIILLARIQVNTAVK